VVSEKQKDAGGAKAMLALYTAATGMKAMSTQVNVIANNLANVNTTAFKRERVMFQDLFYEQIRQPGTLNGQGEINPTGIQIGLGSQVAATEDDFTQGDFQNTSNPLDVAIQGKGFFQVKIYPDVGGGVGYTRAGNFSVNAQGNLVQGGPDGFLLEPPITVPTNYTGISITPDGTVNVTTPGNANPTNVGQISLANFTNPEGLAKIGGTIYVQTTASGNATVSDPGSQGVGTLLTGNLEMSNVDAVTELTNLISAQRNFELNGRVVDAGNQMLQTINNLKE